MFDRQEMKVQRHSPVQIADGPLGTSYAVESVFMGEQPIPYVVVTVSKLAPVLTHSQLLSVEPGIIYDFCLN